MPYYRRVGEVPPKRHTRFRKPDGKLNAEELMGEEGFSFDSALIYHAHLPTALAAIEPVDSELQELEPNHPLKPRHFRTHKPKPGGDPVSGRHLLLPTTTSVSPTSPQASRTRCTRTPPATRWSTSRPAWVPRQPRSSL